MVDTLVNPCYNKDMKLALLLTLLIAGTAQASEFDVCVANGVFYFTEVGAYQGKVTEDLIRNRCKKTTQAYPSVKPDLRPIARRLVPSAWIPTPMATLLSHRNATTALANNAGKNG
jgi:hypothetical protein